LQVLSTTGMLSPINKNYETSFFISLSKPHHLQFF
jgi:hypothetical protein